MDTVIMKTRTLVLAATASAAFTLVACASFTEEQTVADVRPVQSQAAPITRLDGYYGSAVAAIERRDYARALVALQEARALNPSDVRVLNAFGVVYDKLGRFDLSARYYGQARALDANSPVVAANMAYSAVLSGGPAPADPRLAQAAAPMTAPAAAPTRVAVVSATTPSALQLAAPAHTAQPVARAVPSLRAGAAPTVVTLAAPAFPPAQSSPPAPRTASAPAPALVRVMTPPARVAVAPRAAAGPVGLRVARPPLYIVNASGQATRGEPIRLALWTRGWSTPKSALLSGPAQARSVIYYPPSRRPVALALANTLPGKAQLRACDCAGLKLVLGADAKEWRSIAPRATGPRGAVRS
jgi:Flp pilus assembly protein TadD